MIIISKYKNAFKIFKNGKHLLFSYNLSEYDFIVSKICAGISKKDINFYQIDKFYIAELVNLKDIFTVKVGAVSGNDKIFTNDEYGNADFVNSTTAKTDKTRKMIFNINIPYLEEYKDVLMARRIRKFSENDWWQWGRLHHISEQKRIYVNCKTRNKKPFFVHKCKNYDGSVLALFPNEQSLNENELCEKLNNVNWYELGFVCDGRYIFSQKSLENTLLPDTFLKYINKNEIF